MSDREKAGLRGAVKTCIVETTEPPDGRKYWTTTEYSPRGRLLTTCNTSSDGSEWFTKQTYDADDRLTKTVSGKMGEPGDELFYAYDRSGRLLSIANQQEKGGRIDFQYHEQGQKTATIQSFDLETLKRAQSTSYNGSPWDGAVAAGIGVPIGGNIATIYNDTDLSAEAQLRDGQGRIVTRIVRSYNAHGRIVEEKQIQENPALFFTDKFCAEGEPQPTAAQLEAMNRAIRSMLSGRNGTGLSYAYDAQGRVTEMRERNFWFVKVTTTSYNEHGDKSVEVETMTDNSALPVGVVFSMDENGALVQSSPVVKPPELPDPLFGETRVSYAYEYDSCGNWSQQTVNHSSKLGEAPSICHRKLTYY
jgi:YD repeat-containing protein